MVARVLRLDGPVVAPLLRGAILEDGSTLRLPHGVVGAGVGLSFLLGRSFPFSDEEPLTATSAAKACFAYRLDLHLLGRRTISPILLDERAATANLGLDIVHVAGPWIESWTSIDLAAPEISLTIDGNVVARGRGYDPLEAVAWLACHLADQGLGLGGGDLVAAGSCTSLVQLHQLGAGLTRPNPVSQVQRPGYSQT